MSNPEDRDFATAKEVTLGGGAPAACSESDVATAIEKGKRRIQAVLETRQEADLSSFSALLRELEQQGAQLSRECHAYVTDCLVGSVGSTMRRSELPLCGLLESGDPLLVKAAMNLLSVETEAGARTECIVQELERVAHRNVFAPEDRLHAVVLLRTMKRGRGVASVLGEFAFQDVRPDLAEAAAILLVQDALAEEDGIATVRRMAASGGGVLREVAIVTLAEEMDRGALRRVPPIAKRRDLSASLRMRAIRVAVLDASRSRMTRDLLREMLREEYWFDGVAGVHGPEHSLVEVLQGVRESGPAHFQRDLIELAGKLQRVPSDYRLSVKETLDTILRDLDRRDKGDSGAAR